MNHADDITALRAQLDDLAERISVWVAVHGSPRARDTEAVALLLETRAIAADLLGALTVAATEHQSLQRAYLLRTAGPGVPMH